MTFNRDNCCHMRWLSTREYVSKRGCLMARISEKFGKIPTRICWGNCIPSGHIEDNLAGDEIQGYLLGIIFKTDDLLECIVGKVLGDKIEQRVIIDLIGDWFDRLWGVLSLGLCHAMYACFTMLCMDV